ncbi:amylosucrase [Salinibacterium xinjiangense]|uniref:Amylosucrase n=1 Tax=Salinibacterium xinjiangense TaxID=386302 RepID=A0A2C8Y5R9_9MICO|nr:amylosucrase [Salinibacterium xinjiangense]GGK94641.1 amylosucrase [Salinibacterium xinjiangense]SOE45472.1 amylosucrase [Salinibacterium xinjiangense]
MALTASERSTFDRAFEQHFPRLELLFERLYGDGAEARGILSGVADDLLRSFTERPADMKALDATRTADPEWFRSQRMLGAVCYVDLYAIDLAGLRDRIPYFKELGLTYLHLMPLFRAPAGNSDGGYAVSSYRDVRATLGTMTDLAALSRELRAAGISLVVDFIFNHTSDEHDWAVRARNGEPGFEDYYWIFPDRMMPDAFEQSTREVFPDDHPGSFVPLPDGRWVWATFHSFQWDLNYTNPAVFRAMLGEMLFLANQGIEILRMDAVAFIWKQLGTACESLPEAHMLLQAFNAACSIGAPSLLFKSEAIVHPDEVIEYIDPDECQLSYNPLQMALIWSSLATRDVGLLSQALAGRNDLPVGTSWVNYVRSHDDIGWTFADEDAAKLGIDGLEHRRFLNAFYVDRFPGSFARGVPFQENPRTGDARVSGTTASLAGIEARDPEGVGRVLLAHSIVLSTGGIPLLYLGDEVGQLNDYGYIDDPGKAGDSRWSGRPPYPSPAYSERDDPATTAGRIFAGLRTLIGVRKQTAEFAAGALEVFDTWHPSVLGYQRFAADGSRVLVFANFADVVSIVDAARFAAVAPQCTDLVSGALVDLTDGLILTPHEFFWLRETDR